jgi:hypothetical protein
MARFAMAIATESNGGGVVPVAEASFYRVCLRDVIDSAYGLSDGLWRDTVSDNWLIRVVKVR